MKSVFRMALLSLFIVLVGCSKSEDPSPSSVVNLKLSSVESDTGDEAFLQYDDKGRLTTLTSNSDNDFVEVYYLAAGDIQGALNGNNPKSIKDPNLNDNSDVHVYSTTMVNGNPVEIKAIVLSYNGMTEVWEEVVLKITYDDKINPLYLVLEQSGMIPTIDQLVLSSPDPLYSALNAKGLLARNNPVKIEAYDDGGGLIDPPTIISYQYNDQGLPVTATSLIDGVNRMGKYNYVSK